MLCIRRRIILVTWIRIRIRTVSDKKSDPDPHQGEKLNPDPHQENADPQRYSIYPITYAPGHLTILHKKPGQIFDLQVKSRVADPDPHSFQLLERRVRVTD
jgi:hypothetical protein